MLVRMNKWPVLNVCQCRKVDSLLFLHLLPAKNTRTTVTEKEPNSDRRVADVGTYEQVASPECLSVQKDRHAVLLFLHLLPAKDTRTTVTEKEPNSDHRVAGVGKYEQVASPECLSVQKGRQFALSSSPSSQGHPYNSDRERTQQ